MQITIDVSPVEIQELIHVLTGTQPAPAGCSLLRKIPEAVLRQINDNDNEDEQFRQIVEDYLACPANPEKNGQFFEADGQE